MRKLIVIAARIAIFLPCCACWLWWSYSMRTTIEGGLYTHSQALRLVIEMALLTTALVSIVWIALPFIHRSDRRISRGIKTILESWLILALYTSAVFIWREHWTPAKGMSDEAQFMPLVGHVNAAFFSEMGWLEFFIAVVSAMSVLSGLLAVAVDSLRSTSIMQGQSSSEIAE